MDMVIRLAILASMAASAQEPPAVAAGIVSGKVSDAQGGESLARVKVKLLGGDAEALTDPQGKFQFTQVPAGDYVLHVETVGYRLVTERFTLASGAVKEFEIALSPETFQRKDSVEVAADVFDLAGVSTPSEVTLNGAEVKNLSTVLMDDPLRAAQALPGVSANNDYQARFALRGAGFERLGLYLDDTLLHAPFHSIGTNEGDASLSILNGEMISDMLLLSTSAPARYGDFSAGLLQMRTRDGSRDKRAIRIATGFAASSILAEGPFAKGKGSWIASARKSYLRYMIDKMSSENSLGIGFTDAQAKLAYSLTDRQTVSLFMLDGVTDLDRTSSRERSGVNALITGSTRSSLAKVSWQYAAPKMIVSATGSWLRERFETWNRYDLPMEGGVFGDWAGTARLTWNYAANSGLEAGWTTRRLRDEGSGFYYLNDVKTVLQTDLHRGTAMREGGFVEENWRSKSGRIRATAGARWDAHEFYSSGVWLPRASLAVRPFGTWDVQLGWAQYAQYPELSVLTSPTGGRRLLPERSSAIDLGVERRVGDHTRVRLMAWNRDDRDLLERPLFDLRMVNGVVTLPTDSRLYNSARGYSRGVEMMLQRRTANRLSGWVSYTLSYTRERDAMERQAYWSLHDQRHMVNTYASYRLTSSLNLSGRWGYGSGEPMPGFLAQRDGLYYLSPLRNELRMPAYNRLDLRANKSFTYDRWKLTLYAEVINLTNHHNMRFISFDGANTVTARAFVTMDRAFPTVPLAGVTLEF